MRNADLVFGLFGGAIAGFFIGGFVAVVIGGFIIEPIWGRSTSTSVCGIFLIASIVIGAVWGWCAVIEDRRLKEEKQIKDHRLEEEKQQRYQRQIVVLCEESLGILESMPKHLASAEQQSDEAEAHFADRAFAPFWDSIENAAKALARFDEAIGDIKANSSRYPELIKEYKGAPPQFPLARQSVGKLGVGAGTAKRMEAIVGKAQRDFQFAMIYEQRKTNQILVAGFENLAQALGGMTSQIVASIDDLAGSIGAMTSTLEAMHEDLLEEASESAAREEKALQMLDNIQRGRQPLW